MRYAQKLTHFFVFTAALEKTSSGWLSWPPAYENSRYLKLARDMASVRAGSFITFRNDVDATLNASRYDRPATR